MHSAAAAEATNGEAAPSAGAAAPAAGGEAGDNGQPRKQQRGNTGVDVHSAGVPPTGMADDEATAQNLESSLQSCTAHRERIEQMLADEPQNKVRVRPTLSLTLTLFLPLTLTLTLTLTRTCST